MTEREKIIQMRKSRNIVAVALACVMLFMAGTPVAAAEQKLASGITYNEIGSEVEAYVEEHADTTVGMAISIFDRERVIYQNYFGYADKENELSVDADTVFEWGSATKLLVWVSVMQLWEQGELQLDCDIRAYLPEGFLNNLNYDTPVTMTHLMNHTAGFQEVYSDLFVKDGTNLPTLSAALLAHEPEQIYEPGTVTAYSNWGVALAAYIVECVSGMSFADYVHQNIFEPLGMEHTAIAVNLSDNTWVQEQRSELECYTIDGELIEDCFYYITLYPAGSCTSTMEDFLTFAQALLKQEDALFDSTETWKELFSPTSYFGDTDIPANCHGFWVVPYGEKAIGHGGNTAGCSSYLLIEPESGVGVVVMTNQSQESIYNEDMMELIFGKFESEQYFSEERELPDGTYRPARTIRKGPMKFFSLSFASGEEDMDEFWVYNMENGVEKVSYSYSDYVAVPTHVFIGEMALFILWVVATLFSLISLLVKGIRYVINRICRKERVGYVLGTWSGISCGLQIVPVILLLAVMVKISEYDLSSSYTWMFALCGVFPIVMVALAIYGVGKMIRTPSSKVRKVYNLAVICSLVVTVVNILYWELYMFWAV